MSANDTRAQSWVAVAAWIRLGGAIFLIIGTILYAGRLLERIDSLGNQISELTRAVQDMKVVSNTVHELVDGQKSLVQSAVDLRRDVEAIKVDHARIEARLEMRDNDRGGNRGR